MSDHFCHQDNSISAINFLRYSEKQWRSIAGNEFAYCNRLRVSDYLRLFSEAGFAVIKNETKLDESCIMLVRKGFPVSPDFSKYTVEELCAASLSVVLEKSD